MRTELRERLADEQDFPVVEDGGGAFEAGYGGYEGVLRGVDEGGPGRGEGVLREVFLPYVLAEESPWDGVAVPVAGGVGHEVCEV